MASRKIISKLSEAVVTRTNQRTIVSDYEIPQRITCEAPNFNRQIPISKFTLTPTKQWTDNFSIVTHLAERGKQAILVATMVDEDNSASALFVNRNIPELDDRPTP